MNQQVIETINREFAVGRLTKFMAPNYFSLTDFGNVITFSMVYPYTAASLKRKHDFDNRLHVSHVGFRFQIKFYTAINISPITMTLYEWMHIFQNK